MAAPWVASPHRLTRTLLSFAAARFFAPRALSGRLVPGHRVTAFVLPGRCAACSFHSTPWRFCFSPRAMNRRSGCASSAALRPAFACDPACGGTQTGVRTLAVPRLRFALVRPASPPPGLAARFPHASAPWLQPPAGRISQPPPVRRELAGVVSPNRVRGLEDSSDRVSGGGYLVRPWGAAAMAPATAGHRTRGPGRGVGDAASCGHRRAPDRIAPLRSRSPESRAAASGGEQGPSCAAPQGQKKTGPKGKEGSMSKAHAVTAAPARRAPRSGKKQEGRPPAWQERPRGAKKPHWLRHRAEGAMKEPRPAPGRRRDG